jgi:hypothetical protein
METKRLQRHGKSHYIAVESKHNVLGLVTRPKEFQSQTIVKIIVEIDEINLENGERFPAKIR